MQAQGRYIQRMTKQLDAAIEAIRLLPEDRQNEIAAYLVDAAQPGFAYTPDQIAKLDESIAQADAKEFVSAETVAQIFGRYRLT